MHFFFFFLNRARGRKVECLLDFSLSGSQGGGGIGRVGRWAPIPRWLLFFLCFGLSAIWFTLALSPLQFCHGSQVPSLVAISWEIRMMAAAEAAAACVGVRLPVPVSCMSPYRIGMAMCTQHCMLLRLGQARKPTYRRAGDLPVSRPLDD